MAVLHVSRRTGQPIGRCRPCRLLTGLNPLPQPSIPNPYNSTESYRIYVDAQRVDGLRRRHLATNRHLTQLLPRPPADCTVFDVGAREFLALARTAGFQVHGNEISEPAAKECLRRHGITLTTAELGEEAGADSFDAMTMWCVLAHVAGLAATRITSGVLSHVTERRVNAAHLRLYDHRNLRRLLHAVGFEAVELRSVSGYSLQSMGVPRAVIRP